MKLTELLNNSWKIVRKAIIIDIIVIILSIILWALLGKNADISIANILFILGGIITGCGSYFILGAKFGSVDYIYFQSRLASQINYHDRQEQEIDYIEKSYYTATIFFIAGLLAIGVSFVFYKVVG